MSGKNTIDFKEFDDYKYHLYSEAGTNQLFLEIEDKRLIAPVNKITVMIPPAAYNPLLKFLKKLEEMGQIK